MRLKCEYFLVFLATLLAKHGTDTSSTIRFCQIVVNCSVLWMLFFMEKKWRTSLNNVNGKRVEPIWKNFRDCQRVPYYGLWCTFLMMFIVHTTNTNHTNFWILFTLVMPTFFLMITVTVSLVGFASTVPLYFGLTAALLTNFIVINLLNFAWYWSATLSIGSIYLSIVPTIHIMNIFPKSFTLGEFSIIWQATIFCSIKTIIYIFYEKEALSQDSTMFSFANVTFFCLIIGLFLAYCMKSILLSLFLTVAVALIISFAWLQQDYINYAIDIMLKADKKRLVVMNFWLLCLVCTAHFVVLLRNEQKITTIHRKYFHLTISLVLVTGLVYDPELLYLASIVVFYGFIIIEVIRCLNIKPFGEYLNVKLSGFLDHQDQGSLILTPIYLLTACFLPLWLKPCPTIDSVKFVHFAGFISVGVGDAFASIGGKLFGQRKIFTDSGKTFEGTFCGFVAQVLASIIVIYLLSGQIVLFDLYIYCGCALIAMLETFTSQIDNLVLPLMAYVLFWSV